MLRVSLATISCTLHELTEELRGVQRHGVITALDDRLLINLARRRVIKPTRWVVVADPARTTLWTERDGP